MGGIENLTGKVNCLIQDTYVSRERVDGFSLISESTWRRTW
jgi:hypothetical protein